MLPTRWTRQVVAVVAMAAFCLALPVAAVANAAEPVTLADWLRTIYVTPDREIDRADPAVVVPPPAPPPPVLQTSSEQTPPKQPIVRDRVPEGWLRRNPWDPRKRHRRSRPR
jgi:hypothetical protein